MQLVAVQNSSAYLTRRFFFSRLPSPLTPLTRPPKIKMATAEDIFEGAIGIDLGTTYS